MGSGFEQRHGGGQPRGSREVSTALVAIWLILACPGVSAARSSRVKPLKIIGLLTEVEPTRVSIHGPGQGEVTITTAEDFTERVAVGSQVTAWYFVRDGVKVLQWLNYPLENFFLSVSQIRGQVKKVIILPRSSVPDADGIFDAIRAYTETNMGWYVAPQMLTEEIRRREGKSASTLEAIDPSTGHFDIERYVQAHRELVRKLGAEARVDAVLEADVEKVQAKVETKVAHWDGVQQAVAGKGLLLLGAFVKSEPQQGQVPAATVTLKLWNAQGKLLWTNRRGFAVLVLQVGAGNQFRERQIPEVLENTASVEKWLAMVFGSFLAASDARRSP